MELTQEEIEEERRIIIAKKEGIKTSIVRFSPDIEKVLSRKSLSKDKELHKFSLRAKQSLSMNKKKNEEVQTNFKNSIQLSNRLPEMINEEKQAKKQDKKTKLSRFFENPENREFNDFLSKNNVNYEEIEKLSNKDILTILNDISLKESPIQKQYKKNTFFYNIDNFNDHQCFLTISDALEKNTREDLKNNINRAFMFLDIFKLINLSTISLNKFVLFLLQSKELKIIENNNLTKYEEEKKKSIEIIEEYNCLIKEPFMKSLLQEVEKKDFLTSDNKENFSKIFSIILKIGFNNNKTIIDQMNEDLKKTDRMKFDEQNNIFDIVNKVILSGLVLFLRDNFSLKKKYKLIGDLVYDKDEKNENGEKNFYIIFSPPSNQKNLNIEKKRAKMIEIMDQDFCSCYKNSSEEPYYFFRHNPLDLFLISPMMVDSTAHYNLLKNEKITTNVARSILNMLKKIYLK